MKQRRVYSLLPKHFQNDVNKRLIGATDDLLFEPEDFERIEGQIGDDTGVSQSEKNRVPFIESRDPNSDRHPLSPCVVSYNNDGTVSNGAFYSDLVGHILANGGLISDESRLFECDYFSFNPPINIDRWTNFSKYFWTGGGTAKDTGEYVVKEPASSQTVLHFIETDGSFTKKNVILDSSDQLAVGSPYNPSGTSTGDLREDCTDSQRPIYIWDNSAWQLVNIHVVSSLDDVDPTTPSGTYVYVARTGKDYQRPVIFQYSETAGRWISKVPIISNTEPDNPTEGSIWEDSRFGSFRKFLVYENSTWTPLTYSTIPYVDLVTPANNISTMTGIGVPGENDPKYRYAAIDFTIDDDPWKKENWWVHYEDLSANDKIEYAGQQSTRPIIEFWSSIETTDISDDIAQYKIFGLNNKNPLFEVYMVVDGSITKVSSFDDTFAGNTIFQYKKNNTNADDSVLGFGLDYDTTGEILFDIKLENSSYSNNDEELKGYKFFKDTWTNMVHSIWTRATNTLSYDQNSKTVPLNLSNNPNHGIDTSISRRNIIGHYRSIIDATSDGVALGDNSYRWTDRDPVTGASIIDTEGSLLLPLSLLQNDDFDLAESIRNMAFEYNRFMRRFEKRLNRIWDTGTYTNADDTLNGLTATEMVDKVLSEIILNPTSGSPFWNSDMGTFVHETTSDETPILIPPSAARVGASSVYEPRIFDNKILCHDGAIKTAYGDERDDVILNLENRFYSKVPTIRKTETTSQSALLDGHQFTLRNFVANGTIDTNVENVDKIVNDYTSEVTPTVNTSWYSKTHGSFVTYTGSSWTVTSAKTDDVFFDENEEKYYAFNGFDIHEIKLFNKNGTFDYTLKEFGSVIRREFERWYVEKQLDPISNDTFDNDDNWSWNLSSTGIEGYWRGVYKRVYGTDRPHVAPWEILGFTIEPEWWTDAYTADSTDSDGNKRYNSSNAMWADLKTGTLITAEGVTIPAKFLLNTDTPTPVDSSGNLIDPITAGVVSLDSVTSPNSAWVYGDGSPVESAFLDSHFGPFANALAGYLMKPARFVEFLWSNYSFTIGTDANLFGGAIKVDDETLKRPDISVIKIHAEDESTSDPGINSWISENLLLSQMSVADFANTIRKSTVSLGWKANGFIDKASTVLKTLSGVEIPFEDVQMAIHKGLPTSVNYHSGVQIVKRGAKYQVFGYDYTNPFFRINYGARPSVGGQVTLEETFTSDGSTVFSLSNFKIGGPNDLARFSVIIDGFKVNDHYVNIIDKSTFEIIDPSLASGQQVSAQLLTNLTNPSTRVKRFNINSQDYLYYSTDSGTIIDYPYGHEFNTSQEVVEFINDYGRYLEGRGWEYESDTWLDVSKRFALWSQSAKTNQIFVDVASGNSLTYNHEFGHIANIEKLTYGGYSLLDIAAVPIKDFDTFRFDEKTSVSSKELIFGLRAISVDYQHAVFISNTTRFNDLIYDQFTGLRQKRLEIKSLRSREWAGRIDTPGYIANGDTLIPNFEKQTKDFSKYYDTLDPTTDQVKKDQALNLYGWYYKDYAKQMNVNDIMSIDFHKHAIKEKGTNRAVRGFSSSKENTVPLEVLECWAWKEGDFGRTEFDNPVRFSLFESDFKNRIQSVTFGISDETTGITVSDYDRNASHDRWVLAPKGTNFKFPMNGNVPSSQYDVRIVVLEDETVNKKFFHFDPAAGLHEPYAYSQIDIETAFDPAYYNKGTALTEEGYEWSEERVGTIWWDTSSRKYKDYRNTSLSVTETTEQWAKLDNVKIISSTLTVTNTITSIVNSGHDLSEDQAITVSTKDGQEFKGLVDSVSGNIIEYTLVDGPESISILSNAVNLNTLDTISSKSIDVYEWVESRVPPTQFVAGDDNVTVFNSTDPSYTERIRSDGSKRYYFWAKNRKVVATGKDMSAYDIANQLKDPTSSLLPWFGIVNNKTMLFNASTLETRSDLSIQIFTFPKNHEDHDQWVLLVENDKRNLISANVESKIVDSLQGSDVFGNTVPATYRTDLDKFGPYQGQTLFDNINQAKLLFIDSLNSILKTYDKNIVTGFTSAFPVSKKIPNGFWDDGTYDVLGYTPSQVVADVATMEALYDVFENDTVYVKSSSESYKYVDNIWTKVSSLNSTAVVNLLVFEDLRNNIKKIKEFLSVEDYNALMFSMIYEMLRQHSECSWIMKTSYIDMISTVNTGQPINQPFDEMAVIEASVKDMKPFHSKIRRAMASHVIHDGDNAYDETELSISDKSFSKTTINADRLSCNLFDDNGFDTEPFDHFDFDYQTWDRPNLGTTDWETIGTIEITEGDTDKSFYMGTTFPYLDHDIIAKNSSTGKTEAVPSYRIHVFNDDLYINFDTVPPVGIIYTVRRNTGTASEELLNTTTIDKDFNQIAPTYKHARAITGVDCDDLEGCDSLCDDLEGGGPEERIRSDVDDSSIITVTTNHTGAYSGFDGVPFDLSPLDSYVASFAPTKFSINNNNDYGNASLTETINPVREVTLSNDISAGSIISIANGRYTIGKVEIDEGAGYYTGVISTDYTKYEGHSIRINKDLETGDKIRLYAASIKLKSYQFRLTNIDFTSYSVSNDILYFNNLDYASDASMDVEYYHDTLKEKIASSEILNRHDYEVDYKVADHTSLTGQSFLYTDCSVLNDTDDKIYIWDGTDWDTGTLAIDTKTYFVKSEIAKYEFSSGDWNLVYEVGDGTDNLSYNYLGLTSGSILGSSDIGGTYYNDGWKVTHYGTTSDAADFTAFFGFNSIRSLGLDDQVYFWTDCSNNGNNLIQLDTAKTPVYTTNIDPELNSVTFVSGDILETVNDSSLTNLFDGTGNLEIKFKIDTTSNFTLLEKTTEWSLAIASDSTGDYKIIITHDFSTTDGVWEIISADLVDDSFVTLSIQYDNSDVSNDPIVNVNGTSVVPNETSTPVGTATSGLSKMVLNDTGEFSLVSLTLS